MTRTSHSSMSVSFSRSSIVPISGNAPMRGRDGASTAPTNRSPYCGWRRSSRASSPPIGPPPMTMVLRSTHRRLRASRTSRLFSARPTITRPAENATPWTKPLTCGTESCRSAAMMATTAPEASSRPPRLGSSSRMLMCRRGRYSPPAAKKPTVRAALASVPRQ